MRSFTHACILAAVCIGHAGAVLQAQVVRDSQPVASVRLAPRFPLSDSAKFARGPILVRPEIDQTAPFQNHRTRRRLVIGIAVGTVAGGTLGGVTAHSFARAMCEGPCTDISRATLIGVGVGAIVGAGVGALVAYATQP